MISSQIYDWRVQASSGSMHVICDVQHMELEFNNRYKFHEVTEFSKYHCVKTVVTFMFNSIDIINYN